MRNELGKRKSDMRPNCTKLKSWNHTQTSFKPDFGARSSQ
jgi:hypothetical protein